MFAGLDSCGLSCSLNPFHPAPDRCCPPPLTADVWLCRRHNPHIPRLITTSDSPTRSRNSPSRGRWLTLRQREAHAPPVPYHRLTSSVSASGPLSAALSLHQLHTFTSCVSNVYDELKCYLDSRVTVFCKVNIV